MLTKREKRDGRGINVGGVRDPECHSIARVPSATWAHSIEEHAGADLDTLAEFGTSAKTMFPSLLKCDECESGGDYPAHSFGYPVPAELGWVELHLIVDSAEFPSPKPICLATSRVQHPTYSLCCTATFAAGHQ